MLCSKPCRRDHVVISSEGWRLKPQQINDSSEEKTEKTLLSSIYEIGVSGLSFAI
jgi:hypothetical protein